MAIGDIPQIPVPPPGATPDWSGGYSSAYPAVGLSALVQGLTQGVVLGHQMNQQTQDLDLRRRMMANEAGYRDAMLGLKQQHEADVLPLFQARIDALEREHNKPQPQPGTAPATSPDGKFFWTGSHWSPMPQQKQAPGAAADARAMGNLAGAYSSMDKMVDLAKAALPEQSVAAAGLNSIPQHFVEAFPHMFATSPTNVLNDQIKDAAQWNLSAQPHSRFSEEALRNEQTILGGNGETQKTLAAKIARREADLAAGFGTTPEAVRAWMQAHGAGDHPTFEATAGASMQGPIHTYASGRKAQWDGSKWTPIP